MQKTVICTVGIGGWYPRGVARMIQEFNRVSFGFEVQAWVNCLPPGAPSSMIVDGYDYTAYAAKAFALEHARQSGATIAILLDAAFYPVRPIHPLVDHIAEHHYYLCKNGNKVGSWASDACLDAFAMSRPLADKIEEVSSYAVGLNFEHRECKDLLYAWCEASTSPRVIAGPHTANGHEGRNRGHVSLSPHVRGHRHDQTALSIIADYLHMDKLTERPRFTSYADCITEETVLVNQGGI